MDRTGAFAPSLEVVLGLFWWRCVDVLEELEKLETGCAFSCALIVRFAFECECSIENISCSLVGMEP